MFITKIWERKNEKLYFINQKEDIKTNVSCYFSQLLFPKKLTHDNIKHFILK